MGISFFEKSGESGVRIIRGGRVPPLLLYPLASTIPSTLPILPPDFVMLSDETFGDDLEL